MQQGVGFADMRSAPAAAAALAMKVIHCPLSGLYGYGCFRAPYCQQQEQRRAEPQVQVSTPPLASGMIGQSCYVLLEVELASHVSQSGGRGLAINAGNEDSA